jgi:hypothetical protein
MALREISTVLLKQQFSRIVANRGKSRQANHKRFLTISGCFAKPAWAAEASVVGKERGNGGC